MDIVKAIEQLRELREDRLSFIDGKDDDFAEPFKKDVEAIDTILAHLESLPGITTENADVDEAYVICPWCGFPVIKDGDTNGS